MKVASTLLALPVMLVAPLAMAQEPPVEGEPVPAEPAVETAPVEATPVAVETPVATTNPIEEAVAERGVTINGFVSGSYIYNTNAPAGRGNLLRSNDTTDQTFEVDQAEVVFQLAPSEGNFGFRMDLAAGYFGGVQQAIGTYMSKSGLRFDFGRFMTHMGYEVVDGYDGYNDNFSRGLVFQHTIPVFHTGAKVSKTFTDKVSGTLLLVNGWDSDVDADDVPSLGFQLAIAATPMVTAYVNYLGGSEADGTTDSLRNTANVVVVAKPSDKMSFALDATFGHQKLGDESATWYGVALFGKFNVMPDFDLAVRGEYVGDPDGFKLVDLDGDPIGLQDMYVYSVTVTPSYTVVPGFVVRGDIRLDGAAEDIFPDEDGAGKGTQVTLAGNALVAF